MRRLKQTQIAFLALSSLLLLSLSLAAFAGGYSSSAIGTTSGNFLKLGVGARAIGMGEAYTAVADEASALYWNPAALKQVPSKSILLMHSAYVASSYFDYGAYSQNLGRFGAWGAGFQFLSTGKVTETDQTGTSIGSFSPRDMALSLGYAQEVRGVDFFEDLNGVTFGITAKYVQSTLLETAKTGTADIGVLLPTYLDDRLRFALAFSNLGGELKFEQENQSLPTTYRLGSSYRITDHWIAALDLGFPRDNSPYVATGTEYAWPVATYTRLAGRLGFNSRTSQSLDGLTGISLGLGLGLRRFEFDYAFVPMGSLGLTHQVSLNFSF